MNETKINELKAALDASTAAYEAEKNRLVQAGVKSQDRYTILKPLKMAQDAANAEYVNFANGEVTKGLNALAKANPAPKRGTPERAVYNARKTLFMYTK